MGGTYATPLNVPKLCVSGVQDTAKNNKDSGMSCYQGLDRVQLTKYSSTPSTPNIYQVQVLAKYSFFKKYLSTSITFISSTSTHIKIGSKVRMDIQSRVNFGWTKQKGFPQIMSVCSKVEMAIFYAE